MTSFHLQAPFEPTGDQPQAIAQLTSSLKGGHRYQTLLGATGTGKTFSVAAVIEKVGKPTLVLAHNKTLAAQLCNELRDFFLVTRWNTSSATTTTINRKLIFQLPTHT